MCQHEKHADCKQQNLNPKINLLILFLKPTKEKIQQWTIKNKYDNFRIKPIFFIFDEKLFKNNEYFIFIFISFILSDVSILLWSYWKTIRTCLNLSDVNVFGVLDSSLLLIDWYDNKIDFLFHDQIHKNNLKLIKSLFA